MSALCIFHLKEHSMSFEELNSLAREVVRCCLDRGLGVIFNSFDYAANIIAQGRMKNFFFLSDSFLYKNCDFLDAAITEDVTDLDICRKEFLTRFSFLREILEILFRFPLRQAEVFVSTDGAAENINDFIIEEVGHKAFLNALFESIYRYADRYAYEIPSMRFIVT